MSCVRLDLNRDEFQSDLLALQREDLVAVFATLRKIRQMDWNAIYRDHGLKWEAIHTRVGPADSVSTACELRAAFAQSRFARETCFVCSR